MTPKPCTHCGATLKWTTCDEDGGGFWSHPYNDCALRGLCIIDTPDTKPDPIESWNRRADDALLKEALGLLESAPVPLHQPESYLTWAARKAALLAKAGEKGKL